MKVHGRNPDKIQNFLKTPAPMYDISSDEAQVNRGEVWS